MRPARIVRRAGRRLLGAAGRWGPAGGRPRPGPEQTAFAASAAAILARRSRQTVDDGARLRARYQAPVFGPVGVWELAGRLAACVDPTDSALGGTSQLVHTLQLLEGLEADGVSEPAMYAAAVIHDLGKLALLAGEAPEHVMGPSSLVAPGPVGGGLDRCLFQWGHAELAYLRFRDQVPDQVSWLVCYHNVATEQVAPYMDARDREYAGRYLAPFQRAEQRTKSPFRLPATTLAAYRGRAEPLLGRTVLF